MVKLTGIMVSLSLGITLFATGCAYGTESEVDGEVKAASLEPDGAVACTGSEQAFRLMEIDEHFTQEQHETIVAAAKRWDEDTGGKTLHFASAREANDRPDWRCFSDRRKTVVHLVVAGDETDALLKVRNGSSEQTLGVTDHNDVYLYVGRIEKTYYDPTGETAKKLTFEVAMHELGHDMFLMHTDDVDGIMYGGANDPTKSHMAPSDHAEFCDKWSCK